MMRTQNAICLLLMAQVFLFAQASVASAVPVSITGYVADLTGVPHQRPDITIRIRSVASGREIAVGKANNDGFFSIQVDPARVPNADVRLSITADGTALINGVLTAVRTDGTVFSLAGEVDAAFRGRITTPQVTQFIMLVVPKATTCVPSRRCRSVRFRRR